MRRIRSARLVLLCLLSVPALLAQAPVITSVLNGLSKPIVCPGDGVVLYGTLPADAARNMTVQVGSQSGLVALVLINRNVTISISIVVPADAPLGPTTITLGHLGVLSNAFPVTITAVDPVMPLDPYSAFVHNSSGVNVTPGLPAAPGELVSTFVGGLGLTNPVIPLGTSFNIFAPTVAPVTVTVAGKPVTPDFAGHYPIPPPFTSEGYQVSFTVPADTPTGPQPVAIAIGGLTSNTQTLFVGTQALSGQPVITKIANGANFSTAGPFPAGSFASIFGTGFGNQDNLAAFPSTQVNGISVLFNGVPAPIFHLIASAGQINVLVPAEVPPSNNVVVVVQNQNGPSKVSGVITGAAAPALFTIADPGNSSRHNAAALFANTGWLVIPASQAKAFNIPACTGQPTTTLCGQPARAGDFIQLYVTGLGRATPNGDPNGTALGTGQPAPANGNPTYNTVVNPTVTVGGQAAKPLFSGLAPGFSGLYQVNIQIPTGVAPGDNIAVQISMPGGVSDSATVAISQ